MTLTKRRQDSMKKFFLILAVAFFAQISNAQNGLKKVYDETVNPLEQIDKAVAKAKSEGKFVVCQVGGNWCPWCLRFADFITNDMTISKVIADNFEYIHLNNPGRFGFPVFVVLDGQGHVLHIQDSSFLEEGKGYNQAKVLRFFKNWTPNAVR